MSCREGRVAVSRPSRTGRWVRALGKRKAQGEVYCASVNPLFAFSFLDSFLDTLQDYLGEITETTLKDNFDIVYMVRRATYRLLCRLTIPVDRGDAGRGTSDDDGIGHAEGHRPPSLAHAETPQRRRRLCVSWLPAKHTPLTSFSIQTPTNAPFIAPIPWRRPGVRHSTNEIYFDIEESLDAIVDRSAVLSKRLTS